MQNTSTDIAIFLLITTFLIVLMGIFVIVLAFRHNKRQLTYQQKLKEIETSYEKTLLATQLEIQEQTFQQISRDIHDNITLSLTLAKLQLNTIDWQDKEKTVTKVNSTVELLSQSIADLSDVSKSLNADLIARHGLLQAVEEELQRIIQTGVLSVNYNLTGSPVYMESRRELIIFRIIQEAFNNIIKHSKATKATLLLHYTGTTLDITISDNGKGFDQSEASVNNQAGLKNMQSRTAILGGQTAITSQPGEATTLNFKIPFLSNEN